MYRCLVLCHVVLIDFLSVHIEANHEGPTGVHEEIILLIIIKNMQIGRYGRHPHKRRAWNFHQASVSPSTVVIRSTHSVSYLLLGGWQTQWKHCSARRGEVDASSVHWSWSSVYWMNLGENKLNSHLVQTTSIYVCFYIFLTMPSILQLHNRSHSEEK